MTMVWAFFATQFCELGHDHCNLYFETSHFCQFDMMFVLLVLFLSLFLNCMISARRKKRRRKWDPYVGSEYFYFSSNSSLAISVMK